MLLSINNSCTNYQWHNDKLKSQKPTSELFLLVHREKETTQHKHQWNETMLYHTCFKIVVFWDITPCSLVCCYLHFEGTCHWVGGWEDNKCRYRKGSTFLLDAGTHYIPENCTTDTHCSENLTCHICVLILWTLMCKFIQMSSSVQRTLLKKVRTYSSGIPN
jgi:hypothetical protein